MATPHTHRLQILAAALLFSTGGAVIKATTLTNWQVACFRSGLAALSLALLMPSWLRIWRPRTLLVGLAYAATRHWPDERIQGLVINILVRTKSPQFKRVTLPLRTDLIDEWVQKMEVWLNKVMPHYEALDWPPNYASCVHRYGRCPFYSYCEAGEDNALLEDPPPPLDIGDIEV